MKRTLSVLIILIMVFSTCLTIDAYDEQSGSENTELKSNYKASQEEYETDYKEEKIICKATLDDDFADDKVIVVLNHKTSLELKDYTPEDFKQVNAESVENLTSYQINDLKKELNSKIKINEKVFSSLPEFYGLTSEEIKKEAEKAAEKEIQKNYPEFNEIICFYLKEKGKQNVLDTIKVLEKNDIIISAEPSYQKEACAIPNDTKYNKQWSPEDMELEDAWNITKGSNNVKVGVIDSGIASSHTDISPNLNNSLSRSFVGGSAFTDTDGHGTMVASVIGAKGNNNKGIAGVCWNVSLVSLKVSVDDNDVTDIINAINYARIKNLDIINMSITFKIQDMDLINYLKEAINNYKGLFVCAAGNEHINIDSSSNGNQYIYPSKLNCSNILSVASSNQDEDLASHSNYGKTSVDVAAPGVSICVAKITNTYGYATGTSFASPHVAGLAALIKSKYPTISYKGIKAAIMDNVVPTITLINKVKSDGKVNALASLEGVPSHTFTVEYKANGGTGTTMAATTVKYGIPKALRQNTYTKSGYYFNGWNAYRNSDNKWLYDYNDSQKWYTESSAPTGAIKHLYQPTDTVEDETVEYYDTIDMFAVWEPNYYYLNFYDNGGNNYWGSFTICNNEPYNLLTATDSLLNLNNGLTFIGCKITDNNGNWLTKNGTWTASYNNYTNLIEPSRQLNLFFEQNDIELTAYVQWAPNDTLIGDVNLSGSITIQDANMIQLYLSGISDLNNTQLLAADFNEDGYITNADITAIQNYLVNG
ncbi:MAG: S8 family serine peptidase [Ruminococcus sp.]|nr:S8 family serine peptidase [Ruminococcus sp.]